MNVRLYIEGSEVELTEEVQFAITNQFSDLSSPTDIINSFSRTIEIPFTNHNNILFGGIFAPNRAIVQNDGTHDNIGLYFDPSRKLDFKLLWNGSLLMNGYAKMNSIKRKDGNGTYEISLNGQLGYVFQELKKLACYTEQEIADDPTLEDYDLTNEITGTIDMNTVHNSWTQNRTDDDVIGFACCNDGYNDNFKSNSVQIGYDSDTQFTKLLEGRYAQSDHNVTVSPDTLVGDGLKPRSFGEYRSYYQRPYIYIPKMFELLKKKINDLSKIDYELVLHPKWFNKNNHYYYNMVMMLNKVTENDGNESYNNEYDINDFLLYKYYGGSGYRQLVQSDVHFTTVREEKQSMSDDTFSISGNDVISFNGNLNFNLAMFTNGNSLSLKDDNGLIITVRAFGSNNVAKDCVFLVCRSDVDKTKVNVNGYNNIIYVDKNGTLESDGDFHWYFNIPFMVFNNNNILGSDVTYHISMMWQNDTAPTTHTLSDYGTVYTKLNIYNSTIKTTINTKWKRSYGTYDFSDLWDNEHNFFDTILKYTKLFRLMWIVDDVNQTIEVLPTDEYFSTYTVTDWSNKLDMNKDFIVTPCTMDSKYVSLGYEDNESELGEQYLTKNGVNFGDRKLYTYYDFNTDTTKLIEGIPTSIVNTSVGLDWDNLYAATCNGDIIHYQNYETKPYFEDKDGKGTDAFGSFFLYRGLKQFDTKLRDVYITDDTDYQIANEEYMYVDINSSYITDTFAKLVTTYPYLDIVDADGHLCLYNRPMVSYDINNNYADTNTTSIYENFWKEYINERYNLQNNKVECYLYIKPTDYLAFKFKNFIMLGNRAYMINKIEDYNVTSSETTKCELISVYDASAYSSVSYDYPDYIATTIRNITLNQGQTQTFRVKSTNGTLKELGTSSDYAVTITPVPSSDDLFDVTVRSLVQGGSTRYTDVVLSNNNETSEFDVKLNLIGGPA